MSTAIREAYLAGAKLPRLHTAYQFTINSPSPTTATPPSSGRRLAMPVGTSRELPMPKVTRITNLEQAQATLHHCSTRLSRSWQNNSARGSPPGSPIESHERRQFQQWLEQWEHAFTAYLSQSMAGMKAEDITRCRVLKANHLSCTILASEAGSSSSSFDVYEKEFQAIVELATVVMQSRSPSGRDSESAATSSDANAMTTSLDVRDALYVVVARCGRASIRNTAIQLLSKLGAR